MMRYRIHFASVALLVAVTFPLLASCEGGSVSEDRDDDGVLAWLDCDDDDPGIGPPTAEFCNGLDDDCDGEVDEDAIDMFPLFPDLDEDGYGNAFGAVFACIETPATSRLPGDCDDNNPDVHPDAIEVCNDLDDDCDGGIDVDAEGAQTWFEDLDQDGYGSDESWVSCRQPRGAILSDGDCDDFNPNIYPGAEEVCDLIDNNCDGRVDERGC